MSFSIGATANAVSANNTAITAPSWSSTPYVGSLLLITMATSRTTSLTYFGKAGSGTITGWNRFGEHTQNPNYPNRSVERFYKIADGTSADNPPVINGYSDNTTFASLAGTTSMFLMELRNNVVSGVCVGSWDVTNAYGLGSGTTLSTTYAQGNSVGTGTSLTLSVTSGIPETYAEGGLWIVAQTTSTLTAISNLDAAASINAAGTIAQGFKTLTVTSSALPATGSITTTLSGGAIETISAYAIGFNPPKTKTITGTASVAASRTATQLGTAYLRIAANYVTAAISGTADIAASIFKTQLGTAQIIPYTKISMGSGNNIDQVLGSPYFVLSGDIDGGGNTATTLTGGAPNLYTIAIDGGQAIT